MLLRTSYFLAFLTAALAIVSACQSPDEITYARYFTNGKSLYEKHCQNCHDSKGNGLGNLIPPLTDTLYLNENKSQLACMIRHGLTGPIHINGKTYDETMPPNHQLTDIDIAGLVTYITNSFGNKQGLYDVTNAGSDLKNCQH